MFIDKEIQKIPNSLEKFFQIYKLQIFQYNFFVKQNKNYITYGMFDNSEDYNKIQS